MDLSSTTAQPKNQQPNTPQGWKALDLACFTLGISACGRSSQWERAKQLFASIGEIGFQPNPISYMAEEKMLWQQGILSRMRIPWTKFIAQKHAHKHTHIHTHTQESVGLKVWSGDSLLMFWRDRQDFEDVSASQLDASDKCSFAEWACWTSHISAFFHASRVKDCDPTSLWKNAP